MVEKNTECMQVMLKGDEVCKKARLGQGGERRKPLHQPVQEEKRESSKMPRGRDRMGTGTLGHRRKTRKVKMTRVSELGRPANTREVKTFSVEGTHGISVLSKREKRTRQIFRRETT